MDVESPARRIGLRRRLPKPPFVDSGMEPNERSVLFKAYAPGAAGVGRALSVKIEPLLLPIGVPISFDGVCRFSGVNV